VTVAAVEQEYYGNSTYSLLDPLTSACSIAIQT